MLNPYSTLNYTITLLAWHPDQRSSGENSEKTKWKSPLKFAQSPYKNFDKISQVFISANFRNFSEKFYLHTSTHPCQSVLIIKILKFQKVGKNIFFAHFGNCARPCLTQYSRTTCDEVANVHKKNFFFRFSTFAKSDDAIHFAMQNAWFPCKHHLDPTHS